MKLDFNPVEWDILLNKKIKNAVGLLEPMNWTDDSDEEPIFLHPKIPVAKYGLLYLEIEALGFFRVQSIEDRTSEECKVKLYIETSAPKVSEDTGYGRQELAFLSNKTIMKVSPLSNSIKTNGQEILLDNGSSIFVFAGEIEVTEEGYMYRRLDDSLLFCREGKVVDSIHFDLESKIEWKDAYTNFKTTIY